MKLNYYSDTDSLYIDLSERTSVDSMEVAPGVVLDFDDDGNLVGIDIDRASRVVNLAHLEAEALPIQSFALKQSQMTEA
ncbi:MAG: DUF2283 domain-containing protein [Anaerolineae bacterium]|nr:DUF2283 domain-containing protein [Anaerolineae bacterium]